ncbi:unnamed protein product [Linum trigynum]|uniref:DUF7745 domain-containing protein n=1 Tax=Linum trigynum TaxID=586398 RepID=A0AAV2E3B9_9ROSI
MPYLNRTAKVGYHMEAFALLIYGFILYPSLPIYVDSFAIKVLQHDLIDANPITSILSETPIALSRCRRSEGGYLYGCTSLLVVWLFGHLNPSPSYGIPDVQYALVYDGYRRSIQEFTRASPTYIQVAASQWRNFFASFGKHNMSWKAPWMTGEYILYGFEKKHWIPLLGQLGM